MKKIGYVRVSRDTQDVASQVKLMQDLGIVSEDIFVDNAVSGATKPEARPVFKKMLDRLNAGGIDELVFSEFSRIGRNVNDGLMTLIPIIQRGITIRSLSAHEDFINKLPSEMQTWMISGMLFSATMERKHTSERTKWGIENARSQGKTIGRPIVKIDFAKIKATMEQYGLKESQAVRVCGYSETTFYKNKKLSKNCV